MSNPKNLSSHRDSRIPRWIWNVLDPSLLVVFFVIVWQLITSLGHIKPFILASPKEVVAALMNPKWQWFLQAKVTSIEVVGGFVLAAIVGVLLGMAISASSTLRRAFLPLLVVFNSLPKIAMAPLFIIWIGYGIIPNTVIAFISAFFPVVINTSVGLSEIDPDMVALARSLRVPNWKIFLKIRLPNALPYVFSGLKVSSTLAVIGAIVGEFIASTRGLASIIMSAQGVLATDAILASLLWISAIGLGLYGFVVLLQHLFMPWARSE